MGGPLPPQMRLGLALLAVTLLAVGCAPEPIDQWPPVKVYSVRGEVASLPAADRPGDWISIRHEAIEGFIGITGEPEPMDAMTMRFSVADGVDISSLAVGDRIAFELEVDWSADDRAHVIALEPLPPDTELDFQ